MLRMQNVRDYRDRLRDMNRQSQQFTVAGGCKPRHGLEMRERKVGRGLFKAGYDEGGGNSTVPSVEARRG